MIMEDLLHQEVLPVHQFVHQLHPEIVMVHIVARSELPDKLNITGTGVRAAVLEFGMSLLLLYVASLVKL